MKDFTFYTPTRVIFGRAVEEQVGAQVAAYGGKKVLLHYGGGSAQCSGLLDRVRRSLQEAGIDFVELGGVKPNPRLSLVQEGVALCQQEGVDFLLAVGGGSVIDSAKAIAMSVYNQCDPWSIYEQKVSVAGALPLGCVLTIAAAGSEMSDSSVITNEQTGEKRGFGAECCRSRFSLLNPELTMTLPAYQTASGCVDIMMHAMERYFCPEEGAALSSALAEALLRTMVDCVPRLLAKPQSYAHRATVMWAGSLAHNDLLQAGNGIRGDWACHQLEHELSGLYDVAHGAGLAALWGTWARYVYEEKPAKFARFAQNVCGVEPKSDLAETACHGITFMEDFFRRIGMPTNLRELGLTPSEQELDQMAYLCSFRRTRTIGNFKVLTEKDIRCIYAAAR